MRKGIFSKLAVQNIRNNKSTYIPYMITCIFCIAMIYMMEFLRDCPTLDQAVRHAAEVRMILSTGEVIVIIFCVIFLIYSNSFLMKRRQKEIGLYNILGLERNHIAIVLLLETIFTAILSLSAGIASGILASKLSLLLLLRLLHIPAVLGFYVSAKGILVCLAMFGGIFLLILLLNLRRIHLSRPVELLRGSNAGEREPRAKWFMALIGFICLGTGYYLAITTESPIEAISAFLLAVILVMAGTYLLFTAGNIVILKFLRRRKSFYYKTGNFISISGMLYRMKQNAVGLASICILSTGVLLMISMTVSLYFGMGDTMVNRYPYDADISVTGVSEKECQTAIDAFEKAISDNNVPAEKKAEEIYLTILCRKENNRIQITQTDTLSNSGSVLTLSLLRQSEYEKLTGTDPALQDGEIFAWVSDSAQKSDSVTVNASVFSVKKCGIAGNELQKMLLRTYNIEMEMAAGNYVLALTSLCDTDQGFHRLFYAVKGIDEQINRFQTTESKKEGNWIEDGVTRNTIICTMNKAFESQKESVALQESEGRISGEFLYLYPPGIPMIVPGEKIDGTLLKKLEGYKKKGFQFQGLRDYGGEKIEVVK